ncbi:glycosyltransferase family A protein [Pseudoalteromonas sp. TAE56]|uniref:glycosyltransferase family A protein n=1 Tax=Pseudoalteromonas sp. TAE56 TaxID=1938596 RepID=UPI0004140572|nr:glycosyltransferase family A protein [Pseudoalteromonas sp. TAE56]
MFKYHVGVVIPFYQRESGILAKALLSIAAQEVKKTKFTVVIVDDGSPVPADKELASIQLPDNCQIELIKQKNAGPAVARNTALDYLQKNKIDTVAFLDSDDVWNKHHVSEALSALSAGAGFYFCNHSRFNTALSWFESLNCFKEWNDMLIEYNIKFSSDKNLAELSGANCFKLFIREYLSQTSCIVYDFKSLSDKRFDPSLVSAGEDFFLWLHLVRSCEKVIFSLSKNVHCGAGVNIYFDSFDWNKLSSSTQHGYHFILYKMILSSFPLQKSEYALIKQSADHHLNLYSYLMLKHLITRVGFNRGLAVSILKRFPGAMFLIPFRFIRAYMNRKILEK